MIFHTWKTWTILPHCSWRVYRLFVLPYYFFNQSPINVHICKLVAVSLFISIYNSFFTLNTQIFSVFLMVLSSTCPLYWIVSLWYHLLFPLFLYFTKMEYNSKGLISVRASMCSKIHPQLMLCTSNSILSDDTECQVILPLAILTVFIRYCADG